ncbi:hypothetical protein HPB51_000966 [Rhipicephalus microplus]|uniref:Uncharacterized protein n=1 Tax=Rhipicephalus microplus TaxID=6941 RepID=A0A9J6DKK7_RHIMP|nr:hypothetical protein HPB51_000966 [Rhipicephalus microplus]
MMLVCHRAALDDCRQALQRDRHNSKSLLREAKCYIALGDPAAALRSLHSLRVVDPENPAIFRELKSAELLQLFLDEDDKAYKAQNYERVIHYIDCALQQAVSSSKIEILRSSVAAVGNPLILSVCAERCCVDTGDMAFPDCRERYSLPVLLVEVLGTVGGTEDGRETQMQAGIVCPPGPFPVCCDFNKFHPRPPGSTGTHWCPDSGRGLAPSLVHGRDR